MSPLFHTPGSAPVFICIQSMFVLQIYFISISSAIVFCAVDFTPPYIFFAVVLCVGFTPPISFILQVTLGVFLIKAPLTVWAVWVGMGSAWLIAFVVHECVYVCCKIAHRGQKIYQNNNSPHLHTLYQHCFYLSTTFVCSCYIYTLLLRIIMLLIVTYTCCCFCAINYTKGVFSLCTSFIVLYTLCMSGH